MRRDDDPLPLARVIGYPLVVKPASSGQGKCVSVGITDNSGFAQAIVKAGPRGARMVLLDLNPDVEAAVPETARGAFVTGGVSMDAAWARC